MPSIEITPRPARMAAAAGVMLATMWLAAAPAAAQNASSTRAFVSGLGTDTGTCTRAAPCRSFQFALGVTAAGGEIVALDPAGYGPVTISQAVSISGPSGPGAHVTAPSDGTGITISAGSGDAISLRGIEVDGGQSGILIQTAGSVTIDQSVVNGGSGGIVFGNAGALTVTDTSVTGTGDFAINAANGALTLTRVIMSGGFIGVQTGSGGSLVMNDTTITGFTNGLGAGGTAFVKRSLIANNSNTGIYLSQGATVYLDTTTVINNGTAVSACGATFNSYGNNNIVGTIQGSTNTIGPDSRATGGPRGTGSVAPSATCPAVAVKR